MVRRDVVIIMSGPQGVQPVQVTHEAITDIQYSPAHNATGNRPARYVEVFADIVTEKAATRKFAFDGRIWITRNDIQAWRRHNPDAA